MTHLYNAVAIASSAGGPGALKILLSSLSADFPLPIFIVQHISEGHSKEFVEWLNKFTELNVLIAEEGHPAKRGEVILAPNHYHLEVDAANHCHLNEDDAIKGLKPAASKLFSSMIKAHGSRAIGIILSGMGRDGVDELLLMKNEGALTLAQAEKGCVIFGMPAEAIKEGAVRDIVPIEEMGPLLTSYVTPPAKASPRSSSKKRL